MGCVYDECDCEHDVWNEDRLPQLYIPGKPIRQNGGEVV